MTAIRAARAAVHEPASILAWGQQERNSEDRSAARSASSPAFATRNHKSQMTNHKQAPNPKSQWLKRPRRWPLFRSLVLWTLRFVCDLPFDACDLSGAAAPEGLIEVGADLAHFLGDRILPVAVATFGVPRRASSGSVPGPRSCSSAHLSARHGVRGRSVMCALNRLKSLTL